MDRRKVWDAVLILRGDSATMAVDGIAQIFQMVMIAALYVFYLSGWFFNYAGVANEIVILDLCAAPCVAFIVYACVRKNIVALVSAGVFMVCHLIYGVVNFIL